MGAHERAVDAGIRRGRVLAHDILDELRSARLDRGLAGRDVARAVGLSASQYSRIERGLAGPLAIEQSSAILAVVGLELSVRAYPAGEPLRDRAHAALLERLRVRIHRSLRFQTEVAFPSPGDRRAWDAVISTPGWRHGIEAETRPRDRQALERRLALKLADGAVDTMSLVLLDSRYNRDFVRANAAVLQERFPVSGRRTLELFAVGVAPTGNSIILL